MFVFSVVRRCGGHGRLSAHVEDGLVLRCTIAGKSETVRTKSILNIGNKYGNPKETGNPQPVGATPPVYVYNDLVSCTKTKRYKKRFLLMIVSSIIELCIESDTDPRS